MLADETERLFFPSLIIFALDACIFLKFFNICFKLKFMIFSKSGFLWNLRKWLLNIKLGTQKFNIIVCCDSMSYLGIEYYGFVYSDIQSSLLLLLLFFFHTFCYLLFTYYTCSLFHSFRRPLVWLCWSSVEYYLLFTSFANAVSLSFNIGKEKMDMVILVYPNHAQCHVKRFV